MWIVPASICRMARTAPGASEVKMPAPDPSAVPLAWAIALSVLGGGNGDGRARTARPG